MSDIMELCDVVRELGAGQDRRQSLPGTVALDLESLTDRLTDSEGVGPFINGHKKTPQGV